MIVIWMHDGDEFVLADTLQSVRLCYRGCVEDNRYALVGKFGSEDELDMGTFPKKVAETELTRLADFLAHTERGQFWIGREAAARTGDEEDVP